MFVYLSLTGTVNASSGLFAEICAYDATAGSQNVVLLNSPPPTHAHIHIHIYTHTHTPSCTHTHTYTHTCTLMYMYTHTHTPSCTHTHTCTLMYMYTHTHVHNPGQEYARADFRWGVSDSTIVTMEMWTVLFNGPMCAVVIYAIVTDKPYR